MVERNLAKVEAGGPSPLVRSMLDLVPVLASLSTLTMLLVRLWELHHVRWIQALFLCERSSAVECSLPKAEVEGSSPSVRSRCK